MVLDEFQGEDSAKGSFGLLQTGIRWVGGWAIQTLSCSDTAHLRASQSPFGVSLIFHSAGYFTPGERDGAGTPRKGRLPLSLRWALLSMALVAKPRQRLVSKYHLPKGEVCVLISLGKCLLGMYSNHPL